MFTTRNGTEIRVYRICRVVRSESRADPEKDINIARVVVLSSEPYLVELRSICKGVALSGTQEDLVNQATQLEPELVFMKVEPSI